MNSVWSAILFLGVCASPTEAAVKPTDDNPCPKTQLISQPWFQRADTQLQAELMSAKAAEQLDVVLILKVSGEPTEPEPDPNHFDTRDYYRAAMVERRKKFIKQSLGRTIDELKALGLDVTGGDGVTRGVRIQGPVESVILALKTDAVVKALSNMRPTSP